MPSSRTRIVLHLGPLKEPLTAAATANGVGLSVEIRRRLAESLGVPEPDMREFLRELEESEPTDKRQQRKN